MLQDSSELDVVEQTVLDGSLPIHFINLNMHSKTKRKRDISMTKEERTGSADVVEGVYIFVCEAIAHRRQQLPEAVFRQDASVILIKAAEGILDDVLGIGALQALSEQGEEHGEIDGTRSLVHHGLQVLVSGILAEGGQHIMQVLLLHKAIAVLVDHIESLLEFGDLSLIEHGEHIGGGTLGAFLGGGTAAGRLPG